MDQQNEEKISNLYDNQVYPSDVVSILLLIIYFPIGLLLLVIRLVVLLILLPNIDQNGALFKILSKILGLQTTLISNNNNSSYAAAAIYISNHLTCFDYLVLKSQISNLNLFEINHVSSNLLNKSLYLTKNTVQSQSSKKSDDEHLQSYCVFPEIESTNGKYGLLEFSSEIFDSILLSKQTDRLVPVCLRANYCLLPFSINTIRSNALTQVVCTLFAPAVSYRIELLDVIQLNFDNSENKVTGAELAKQLQLTIATNLKVKCTKLSLEDYKQLINNQNSVQTHNKCDQDQETDYDLKRLIHQIKEILPDLPQNIIRDHIREAQTLDIDSLITGLLEKMSEISSVAATPPVVIQKPRTTPVKKKIFTYAERKQALIEEARTRYLIKENQRKNL